MGGRITTSSGEMARLGFADASAAATAAATLIERHGDDLTWLRTVAGAADPDRALAGLVRLDEAAADVMDDVWADHAWFTRVVTVLGASVAVQQHLAVWTADVVVLNEAPTQLHRYEIIARLLASMGRLDLVGKSPDELATIAITDKGAADALRIGNRREVMRIAARDLCADDSPAIVDSIAAELADLADAVMTCALMIARGEVAGHEQARLAIIGLGKCGARELNYISDVDVLYVGEPASDEVSDAEAIAVASRLAAAVARICSARTAAGSIWQVDAGLRPEGHAGPLVRTLAGMAAYYKRWASNWEFQAMLKARPMAGDLELGAAFVDIVDPLVWAVGSSDNFVADTQAMRRRVISLIPAKEADRELKLGRGGLRDVEFSVQLLQLVHGRADERIRVANTLQGLEALVECGYIGRRDGAELADAYRLLRTLEHRVQLSHLRRTHLLPNEPEELRRIGRSLRLAPDADVWELWRSTAARVSVLHERVFYSPLLAAVSRLNTDDLKLSAEAAQTRLRALGFSDPVAALDHIGALTRGVSRTAEIQRQLMPAMLGWFAAGPNPDFGLLSFRQVSESLGSTPWYLRALRDEGNTAERLARILSSSRYLVDLLRRDPASVDLLFTSRNLVARTSDELRESMNAIIDRHDEPVAAINAVRALRRRELFRLAVGDLLGTIELEALGAGLSDLAAATIDAALRLAREAVPDAPPLGVVAVGRWGGRELSYGSDADVMFVIADDEEAGLSAATRLVTRARELLNRPGPEPALELDADLRPEGRNGPLVRTLSSYEHYYRRWSSTWEAQALIRANVGAGDQALVEQLLAIIDTVRWPADGLTDAQVLEIRRMKARMQTERIKRIDPARHLKLGPGGLSDVEWTAQLRQLQHAGKQPTLRTPNTLEALAAIEKLDIITFADERDLAEAWRFASRMRNAVMLVRGRAQDALPADPRDIAAAAMLLGYGKSEASRLVDDWGRTSRHALRVVDKIFWGGSDG